MLLLVCIYTNCSSQSPPWRDILAYITISVIFLELKQYSLSIASQVWARDAEDAEKKGLPAENSDWRRDDRGFWDLLPIWKVFLLFIVSAS